MTDNEIIAIAIESNIADERGMFTIIPNLENIKKFAKLISVDAYITGSNDCHASMVKAGLVFK